MSHTYILYNTLAGNKEAWQEKLEKLKAMIDDPEPGCIDVTTIPSYANFVESLERSDRLYLCGGDGTINRFVNGLGDRKLPCELYYYASGSGNDFLRDLEREPGSDPICINEYLVALPYVTVNGKTCRFLNNVGFGIDGYCTEVGDRQKQESDKAVNYTAIAIKGLLFHYKPTGATVTVDGTIYRYKKAWLAPTMNGRFYGGGMMAAPDQDRCAAGGTVSVMLMHGSGKLHTLMVFPSIFKGEHIKHKKVVAVHSGHHITVEFDRPAPLQIDGETILGVTKYEVHSAKANAKRQISVSEGIAK